MKKLDEVFEVAPDAIVNGPPTINRGDRFVIGGETRYAMPGPGSEHAAWTRAMMGRYRLESGRDGKSVS